MIASFAIVLNDGNGNYSFLHERSQVETLFIGLKSIEPNEFNASRIMGALLTTGLKYHSSAVNVIAMDFVLIYSDSTARIRASIAFGW